MGEGYIYISRIYLYRILMFFIWNNYYKLSHVCHEKSFGIKDYSDVPISLKFVAKSEWDPGATGSQFHIYHIIFSSSATYTSSYIFSSVNFVSQLYQKKVYLRKQLWYNLAKFCNLKIFFFYILYKHINKYIKLLTYLLHFLSITSFISLHI